MSVINWLMLRRRIHMKERFDPYTGWVQGAFYSGTFQSTRTWGLTSLYIPVKPSTVYTMKFGWHCKNDAGDYGFDWGEWFNSSFTRVGSILGRTDKDSSADATSPATAAYVRVTVWKTRRDTCYMREKNTGIYIFKGRGLY